MKKIIYGLFLLLPLIVKAAPNDMIITEIGAYKAADHEWIEVYNRGALQVDLTGWKFFEDDTNHKLTAYRGDFIIDPGEYAIIADVASNFEIDYPNFKGTIIDSSWTILKESGEPVALKDASGNVVESFTYIATANGSLERIDYNLPDYSSGNWKEKAGGDSAGFANITVSSESSSPGAIIDKGHPCGKDDPCIEPARPVASVPAYGQGSLVINEFMSDPGDDAVEWVEILNKAEVVINLSGWTLEDAIGKIAELTGEILPQGWRVFELATSRLNNNGDQIKLFDAKGALIDSVTYGSFDDGKITDNAPKARSQNSVARGVNGLDTDEDSKNFFISLAPTPSGPNNVTAQAAQDEENIEEEVVTSISATLAKNENSAALKKEINKESEDVKKIESHGRAEIQGTVSVPPGVLASQVFYIETNDGGREIYMFRKDFPKLALGDNVQIQGIESDTGTRKRIKIKTRDDIEIFGKDTSRLAARTVLIEDLTEDDVASLIKISGEIIESKGKNKFVIADDSGEILIYIKPSTGIADFNYVLGDKITVTGILSKIVDGLRLMPRWPSDFINNSSKTTRDIEPIVLGQPVSLGKNRARGIAFGSLGASGLGALFLGIKFRDKILPRRRKKQETQEEIIDLDKYE